MRMHGALRTIRRSEAQRVRRQHSCQAKVGQRRVSPVDQHAAAAACYCCNCLGSSEALQEAQQREAGSLQR